jgi:hypothetical protein
MDGEIMRLIYRHLFIAFIILLYLMLWGSYGALNSANTTNKDIVSAIMAPNEGNLADLGTTNNGTIEVSAHEAKKQPGLEFLAILSILAASALYIPRSRGR